MVLTPSRINFSLLPQNWKESDLSPIGDLKYILYGHFDEKKIGGTGALR